MSTCLCWYIEFWRSSSKYLKLHYKSFLSAGRLKFAKHWLWARRNVVALQFVLHKQQQVGNNSTNSSLSLNLFYNLLFHLKSMHFYIIRVQVYECSKYTWDELFKYYIYKICTPHNPIEFRRNHLSLDSYCHRIFLLSGNTFLSVIITHDDVRMWKKKFF